MKRRLGLLLALIVAALVAHGHHVWSELRGADDDLPRLARGLGIAPGMTVAEIGAGKGAWTVEIARFVGPTGRVYSTELSPQRLDQVRAAVADAGLRNVVVVQAAAGATNLPARCCDAIFMRTVYHHLTQPHAINTDVHRALRPGGRIGVVDFEPGGLWQWYFRLRGRAPGGAPTGVPADRGEHGVRPVLVEEELRAAGFVLEKTERRWSRGLFLVVARAPDAPEATATRRP
jgi:SAM-dependent methyltransferase